MSKKITIIAMLACVFNAWAQQDTTYLREVVITGNRSERSLDEVNRNVSVISEKEIRSLPYQNVAELFVHEPGVFVVGQGQNPGTNQSLFLRGANSNQVNVLIDGVRLADPSTPGGSLDLSELSLVNVERIEILRGSHGTMYGTSGIGGVINVITKKDEPGWKIGAQVQGGLFERNGQSLKNGVTGRYQLDNGLYVSGGYENLIVNGLDASLDTTSGGFNPQDQDDFRKLDYFGQLGYQGRNFRANVFYKNIHQKADLDQGAFDDDDNYFLEFDRSLLTYQASYDFNNLSLQYQGGWSLMERFTENDSSVIDTSGNYDNQFSSSENIGKTLTNEVQLSMGSGTASLLLGLGHYNERMNLKSYYYSSSFGGFELASDLDSLDLGTESYYAFLQSILSGSLVSNQLESFQLTLGARLTNHNQFGNQFSFEVSPGYQLENGKLFFSLSSGYKNPSLTQLYDPAFTTGYTTTRGNENLSPEKSISFELGWDQKFDQLGVQLSLFQTSVEDVIEYVYLWDASSKAISELDFSDYRGDTYVNLSRMDTRGVELGFDWRIIPKLSVAANYSYLMGEIIFDRQEVDEGFAENNYVQLFSNGQFLEPEREISEDQLVRRPSNLLNASLTYNLTESFQCSLNYRFTDSRQDSFYDPGLGPFGAQNTLSVGSYNVFDFVASYNVGKSLSLGLRVENLLNEDYREIQGFNTRGRGFYFKINYILSGK